MAQTENHENRYGDCNLFVLLTRKHTLRKASPAPTNMIAVSLAQEKTVCFGASTPLYMKNRVSGELSSNVKIIVL